MSISILLLTCSKYDIFTNACLYFINKNIISECNCNLYYSNNTSKCEIYDNVVNIDCSKYFDINFSSRLRYSLEFIKEKYIFLIQEDHMYVYEFLKQKDYIIILALLDKYHIDQIKLMWEAYSGTPEKTNEIIYENDEFVIVWANGISYPIAHHGTIFNKSFLEKNLDESIKHNKQSPWEHETYNLKYKNCIKSRTSDTKEWKTCVLIKKSNPKKNLETICCKGKVTKSGLNLIDKNIHIKAIYDLKNNLKYSTFI